MKDSTNLYIPEATVRHTTLDPLLHNTLEIKDCERIILSGTSVDIRVELLRDKIDRFEKIVINGIEFRRVG